MGYSQSLFGFNSFKWERKIEPLKYEKAKKEYLYSTEEIAGTVIQYFFNLAMAQMEYDLALENVSTTDSLYRIGTERLSIASISQADLLTLKLDALNAKNTLKTVEVDVKRAMFSFASYLNLPKDTEIKLSLPQKPATTELTTAQALQLSKENNPDYMQFQQNLLEAERELARMQRKSAFDATISASVGFNQVADNFQSAYVRPLQQDVVRIGVNIPLLDWGVRRGKVNMAKSNLNVTRISSEQAQTNLEQDVVLTLSDFSVQQNLIASAEEAKELANMAYNSTKQRFIIGKADINSLTLSLNRLNTAQKNYIVALKNYWLSYYKLRKLTLFDFETNQSLSAQFDQLMHLQ
jgi:outer membrane protein TolC